MPDINHPALWKKALPIPGKEDNKYTRGHAIIVGGALESTGATRLAAIAALRAGAGLVSVACTPETLPIYAATLTAVMTKPVKNISQLNLLLEDDRVTSVLIGPGFGVNKNTREYVLNVLSHKKPCVLDADALTAFAKNQQALYKAINGSTVMTPHEGEFSRLFSFDGSRTERARMAAAQSNAVMVLKGSDTVIAAPDGRIVINEAAPPWLATAGSGDVLAGIITGLLAQKMPTFEAACAGIWMHSRAATLFGAGLIAEDLPHTIPAVLKELYAS